MPDNPDYALGLVRFVRSNPDLEDSAISNAYWIIRTEHAKDLLMVEYSEGPADAIQDMLEEWFDRTESDKKE